MAGEEACYQTVVSQNGQLFLLGTKGVYVYTLRNWREVGVQEDCHIQYH